MRTRGSCWSGERRVQPISEAAGDLPHRRSRAHSPHSGMRQPVRDGRCRRHCPIAAPAPCAGTPRPRRRTVAPHGCGTDPAIPLLPPLAAGGASPSGRCRPCVQRPARTLHQLNSATALAAVDSLPRASYLAGLVAQESKHIPMVNRLNGGSRHHPLGVPDRDRSRAAPGTPGRCRYQPTNTRPGAHASRPSMAGDGRRPAAAETKPVRRPGIAPASSRPVDAVAPWKARAIMLSPGGMTSMGAKRPSVARVGRRGEATR